MSEPRAKSTMQAAKDAVEGANAFLGQNVAPVLDDLVARTQEGTTAGLWSRRAARHLTIIQKALELLGQDVDVLKGILAPPKKTAAQEMREEVRQAPPAVRRFLQMPKVAVLRGGLRATLDEQSAETIVEDDGVSQFSGGDEDFPEPTEPDSSTDEVPEQQEEKPDVGALRDLMKRQVAQRAVINSATKRIAAGRSKLAAMKPHTPGRAKLAQEIDALTGELAAAQEELDRLDGEAQLLLQ